MSDDGDGCTGVASGDEEGEDDADSDAAAAAICAVFAREDGCAGR